MLCAALTHVVPKWYVMLYYVISSNVTWFCLLTNFDMRCWAMLWYAMMCYVMQCYAVLCCVMICYAMLWCYAMLCYAVPCYDVSCWILQCYCVLCYATLCNVMRCVATQCNMTPWKLQIIYWWHDITSRIRETSGRWVMAAQQQDGTFSWTDFVDLVCPSIQSKRINLVKYKFEINLNLVQI